MTPPDGIDNVWGFGAFLIFAIIVGAPGLASYRATKKEGKKTDRVLESATITEDTLTKKNSGSHIKDQLDRIEVNQIESNAKQEDFDRRLNNMEHIISRKARWRL